jgi:hypothetical protein
MIKKTLRPDVSVHQPAASAIKLSTASKSIAFSFTSRPLTGHAGLCALAGFLRWQKLLEVVRAHLPFQTSSPNARPMEQIVLSYILGMLSGARSLSQLAYLRRDTVLSQIFSLALPSQSTFSRFFARFTQADNQRFFSALWRFVLESLPRRAEGYTLDFDSTHLCHDDNFTAQGLATGYTPQGFARNYHPLIAVVAEARLAAGFWLRPGDTRSDNNIIGFTRQVLSHLPASARVSLVRADAGFGQDAWLSMLESQGLDYIVVARLHQPLKELAQTTQKWTRTTVAGVEVAEEIYQGWSWSKARRTVLIRHEIKERPQAGGKMLFEQKTYRYQALWTSLPLSVDGLSVWRRYNGRAGLENVIKELDENFALPQTSLRNFWGAEAALSLSVISYNLSVLLQQFFGWKKPVRAETVRQRLFRTGGVLSQRGGQSILRISAGCSKARRWWQGFLSKLSSLKINCMAVEAFPT